MLHLRVVLALLLAQPLPHAMVVEDVRPPLFTYPQDSAITAFEVDLIRAEAKTVDHDTRKWFYRRYTQWRATWAGPAAPSTTPEYEVLESMGTKIMPLLIEKLLEEPEAPAMVLYDHIIPLEYFVQGEAAGPDSPVLRLRALKTIRRWLTLWPMKAWERKD
jgi:hypothetical protein